MDKSMDIACAEYPVIEYIKKVTWSLPVRSNFQYLEDQEMMLYGLFTIGQKNKKKVTPEEAVAEIRKKLPADQFVKTKQVKALFNRLASLVIKRKLNMDITSESKKTRKKVEIMTTMMKDLGNFATQTYRNR